MLLVNSIMQLEPRLKEAITPPKTQIPPLQFFLPLVKFIIFALIFLLYLFSNFATLIINLLYGRGK